MGQKDSLFYNTMHLEQTLEAHVFYFVLLSNATNAPFPIFVLSSNPSFPFIPYIRRYFFSQKKRTFANV